MPVCILSDSKSYLCFFFPFISFVRGHISAMVTLIGVKVCTMVELSSVAISLGLSKCGLKKGALEVSRRLAI